MDLTQLLQLLHSASRPDEIFGGEASAIKRRYRELMALAHPDHNPTRRDEAHEAATQLQDWYAQAQRLVAQGAYGRSPRITAQGRLYSYVGYAAPLGGDICDLYPASGGGQPMLLKVARRPHSNDLLQAEGDSLRKIEHGLAGQALRAHFPTLVESFLLRDQAGDQRAVNVLHAEEGYVSLAEVLRAYPAGIHPADAAWMFNRILAALGSAHALGLVHGAVLPTHVLIRPGDHNGVLIDWCYSVESGEALAAISRAYAADYPPEVLAKQPASSATDLYMAARCMLRLLGGDLERQELPPGAPKAIQQLLRACLLPAPLRRANDAWQVFDDFHAILGELYGPPRFRHFQMPA